MYFYQFGFCCIFSMFSVLWLTYLPFNMLINVYVYFWRTPECGKLPDQYRNYDLAEDGMSFYDACGSGLNTVECVNGTWVLNDTACGDLGNYQLLCYVLEHRLN